MNNYYTGWKGWQEEKPRVRITKKNVTQRIMYNHSNENTIKLKKEEKYLQQDIKRLPKEIKKLQKTLSLRREELLDVKRNLKKHKLQLDHFHKLCSDNHFEISLYLDGLNLLNFLMTSKELVVLLDNELLWKTLFSSYVRRKVCTEEMKFRIFSNFSKWKQRVKYITEFYFRPLSNMIRYNDLFDEVVKNTEKYSKFKTQNSHLLKGKKKLYNKRRKVFLKDFREDGSFFDIKYSKKAKENETAIKTYRSDFYRERLGFNYHSIKFDNEFIVIHTKIRKGLMNEIFDNENTQVLKFMINEIKRKKREDAEYDDGEEDVLEEEYDDGEEDVLEEVEDELLLKYMKNEINRREEDAEYDDEEEKREEEIREEERLQYYYDDDVIVIN